MVIPGKQSPTRNPAAMVIPGKQSATRNPLFFLVPAAVYHCNTFFFLCYF